MIREKPCLECDGEGYWLRVVGENTSGLGGISPITRTVKCEECGGTGKVECEDEDEGEEDA